MKFLFQTMILASICMALSQGMEIVNGPSVLSTVLNLVAFVLFGIGIWGLHFQQVSKQKSMLSQVGTALLCLGALAFVVLNAQLLQSFQTGQVFDRLASPVFMVAGAGVGLGTILFGLSVIRIAYYPKWTGILLMLLPLINIATEVLLQTSVVRYYLNFVLAGVLIYMSMIAIKAITNNSLVQAS